MTIFSPVRGRAALYQKAAPPPGDRQRLTQAVNKLLLGLRLTLHHPSTRSYSFICNRPLSVDIQLDARVAMYEGSRRIV